VIGENRERVIGENRERVIGQGEAHLVLVRLGSVSVDDFREVVALVKA